MLNLEKHASGEVKKLPLLLLLDRSGSMADHGKIDELNKAVKEMLQSFNEIKTTDIQVGIITFGETADIHSPLMPASNLMPKWEDLLADGRTPMGSAFKIAKEILEDKEQISSKAYRPLVILVSDGMPTDLWETELDDFINTGRSQKCDRMAMSIGKDAELEPLEKFIIGTDRPVFEAKSAADFQAYFKFITMSVTTRTLSQNPNIIPHDEEKKHIDKIVSESISDDEW